MGPVEVLLFGLQLGVGVGNLGAHGSRTPPKSRANAPAQKSPDIPGILNEFRSNYNTSSWLFPLRSVRALKPFEGGSAAPTLKNYSAAIKSFFHLLGSRGPRHAIAPATDRRHRHNDTGHRPPGQTAGVDADVLFASLPVKDFPSARAWYERFFGRPADVVAHDHEVMWRVTDGAWLYIVLDVHEVRHGYRRHRRARHRSRNLGPDTSRDSNRSDQQRGRCGTKEHRPRSGRKLDRPPRGEPA